MSRAGAKRDKQADDVSPPSNSASKKRRTEKKTSPKTIDPSLKTFCDRFKNPEDAMRFLLKNAKMSVTSFFKNHWGVKPLVMESTEASKDVENMFTFEFLEDLAGQCEHGDLGLIPGRDFIFSKVVDDKHEKAEAANMTKALLRRNYANKFAIQINQPQRFQDCIWTLMEKLESYLASLVSCQALLVPKGTQSHPLRYEDTEKFILQLSGSTRWKLYSAKGEQPDTFNDDLTQEDIGEERLSATLKAGDVLYIPKGIIFESRGKENSVYLDFGTYRSLDQANLLKQTIIGLIEEQAPVFPNLRRPLPPGYLLRPSSVTNAYYADMLDALAETIRSREKPLALAEGMIQHFMASRLPPYGRPNFEPELSGRMSKGSKISLRNREHITWFVRKSIHVEMEEDSADEESTTEDRDLSPKAELVVLSSLNNDRHRHMITDSAFVDYESDAFSIAAGYKGVLEKLEKSAKPIKVEELTDGIENCDSLDPVILANALLNIGAISVSK